MIVLLSSYYSRRIAVLLMTVFSLSIVLPLAGRATPLYSRPAGYRPFYFHYDPAAKDRFAFRYRSLSADHKYDRLLAVEGVADKKNEKGMLPGKHTDIGGPNQPEMSSFKSVGTDNMVNLFTGDFSYNIPLLDVGGYPVNIYYDGGVSPEQEASWVGLGWNINPGNINRNTRGVPDDFNGQDTLLQLQTMKPNKTWGLGIGGDLELIGIKAPVSADLGVAFNNYLGPSLDLAIRGHAGFQVAKIAGSEKFSAGLGMQMTAGIDINSRAGTSFSGGVSLTANAMVKNNTATFGVGASTGYNSRNGIKALQISEQMTFSSNEQKTKTRKDGSEYSYNAGGSVSFTLHSNSISFLKPSYIPAIRMPLTNTAWSGHFQAGLGSFGVAADVEAEVYGQKSMVAKEDTLQKKPMVGYLYYQNAANNPAAVMDFTRFNDKEVTPNTPVVSVPQYSYDVFSIQGEGTGGSIRAFRNDLGYVRDNLTTSKDKNLSLGADIDPPGHWGGNYNLIKTPSTISEWNVGNKLRNVIPFTKSNGAFENVYFRNPGEASVIDSNRFAQIGGTDLVRFVLGGTNNSPTIEPKLQTFNGSLKAGTSLIDLSQRPVMTERNKRTQVISFLTAEEATVAGLDKTIKNYDDQVFLDNTKDTLLYQSISRVDGKLRKAHHISQINVTESNGRRYIYGLPVYNIIQKDFTFSVDNSYSEIPDKVNVNSPSQMTGNSGLLDDNSSRDGYVQVTSTPGYAHSFLLSGILSPDYVDVTGNGISEDDLGDAIKFNYSRVSTETDFHKWRTPLTLHDSANFNAGNRSEVKDDKGLISYGERESWYLQSVESKTMIALFYVSNRSDAKGATDPAGGINSTDNTSKKLDSIALYSKADLKANGLQKAKSIKTVHFSYSYTLCQNTPDNPSATYGSKGKLTLDSIYFTYNGKTRAFRNKYIFSYTSNPDYGYGTSDRWGTYKPASMNPGGLKNSDYPYSIQDTTLKSTLDNNASAWMLSKITLPSGGEISVNYESDDYAFVQNKRAADMMKITGFGSSASLTTASDRLYNFTYPLSQENDYVFIQVPEACTSKTDVFNKYLQGMNQLAFKIWVQMPKGPEYLTCYATYNDYGVSSNQNVIWIKMNRLGGKSPLSITTLEYLRQQLPGQAFQGYDVSGEPGLKQVGDMLLGMLKSLRDAFTDPVNALRKDAKAMHTDLSKCFVRLNDPDGYKYGGGYRVKSVVLKDNWNKMTGQFTSTYGQQYNYTTTESFNGALRTISSGVASYEPSIGGEENPFQSIIQIEDNLPAGPTSYGAIEMPVLDAFFPSPMVGYSKVTVTSLKTDTSTVKKSRSGIGKQVSEFYTAKDFPVYYTYSPFDASCVKEFHQGSTTNFFHKYEYDFKAQSQGFLIVNNDMNGKMKSQSSYAENDTATRINYTQNFYRNTGLNGLGDKFSFIRKDGSGAVMQGNMGVDVELMTDTREFAVNSSSLEIQGQVDIFYVPFPFPIPTVWPVSGISQNIYRSVTTTKVVNYHSVLDSVVVIDKGSQVSTKNLAYDAETGEVLITRTNNEFNKPVYNTSLPAYWAYSGMGLAYKNIDAVYSGINFSDGKITNSGFDASLFESGDELLIRSADIPLTGCDSLLTKGKRNIIWAFDKNKNNTSLSSVKDFIFIDSAGTPFTMSNTSFRIIRSGHRNMLDGKVANFVGLVNPIADGKQLVIDSASKIINASATEYREKWQTDDDIFRKLKTVNVVTPGELAIDGGFGSFNSSNPAFVTDYTYSPGSNSASSGKYRVTASSASWFSGASSCTSTGSSGGNFLQVDGGSSVNRVWSETVNVLPNARYVFSANITSLNASTYQSQVGRVQLYVNGVAIGQPFSPSASQCTWTNIYNRWNSGSATQATIAIMNLNTFSNGNDYGLDDISFKIDECSIPQTEVEDSTGYLEKSINPYCKGLIGNFRPNQSMVFYDNRKEYDTSAVTDIASYGLLKSFHSYWNFNASHDLVPDRSSTQWVWNSKIDKFNAKGLELETRDALGIYTAAQYGYNKTLAVAISANASYNEMFGEGFEDYGYNELLDNTHLNIQKRHVDFSSLPNGILINTDTFNLRAHSGKYVLGIKTGTSIDTFAVIPGTPVDTFNLSYKSNVLSQNSNYGYTSTELGNCDIHPQTGQSSDAYPRFAVFTPGLENTDVNCTDSVKLETYLIVDKDGNYVIRNNPQYQIGVQDFPQDQFCHCGTYDPYANCQIPHHSPSANFSWLTFSTDVYDLNNKLVYQNLGNNSNFYLARGTYKLTARTSYSLYIEGYYQWMCPWGDPISYNIGSSITATNSFNVFNTCSAQPDSFRVFNSLNAQNICSFTSPVAASDSMMNGTIKIQAGKKMLFSAWVHEDCGNPDAGIPCQAYSFTHNQVQIRFQGNGASDVTLSPSGQVIDGWQRYEGTFTAPSNASYMTLGLVNSGSATIYFDDVRIHPFNANMKTYVYDPVSLRLIAELDANNYASYYEYDEEGTLIRTKVETKEGIKTISETRSSLQKVIK